MIYLRIKILRHRLFLLVLMVSVITPCIATAGIIGFVVVAQTPLDVVHQLGDKNLAYWFIALAVVAIASWCWFAKLLITQLENQRTANSTINAQLIDFMQKDHSEMRSIVARTNEILDRVLDGMDGKSKI